MSGFSLTLNVQNSWNLKEIARIACLLEPDNFDLQKTCSLEDFVSTLLYLIESVQIYEYDDYEGFTESLLNDFEGIHQALRDFARRLTPVAGEGAGGEHSEGASNTRPSPEP